MDAKRNELAPCGIYCGACPHYFRKCFGCSSEIREQVSKGKWACRVRRCCYETHDIAYCSECDRFPCALTVKKFDSPLSEKRRFAYRKEVADNLNLLHVSGIEAYIELQRAR